MAVVHAVGDKIAVHIHLLDASYKTVLMDTHSSIADVTAEMLAKCGFGNAAALAHTCAIGECLDGVTISRPIRPEKNALEVMASWPSGTAAGGKLVFFIKLFVRAIEECPDARALYLQYIQAVYNVVTGIYPVSIEDAVQLAALQVQAKFGSHKPEVHKFGYLSSQLRGLVPATIFTANGRSALDWERDILAAHAALTPEAQAKPMVMYIALLRTKDFYGAAIYTMRQRFSGLLPQIVFVGVSARGLFFFDKETRATMEKYALTQVHKWGYKPEETFYFQLKPSTATASKGMTFDFETRYGQNISDLLTDYANNLLAEWASAAGAPAAAAAVAAKPRTITPTDAATRVQATFRGYKVRNDLQRYWAAVRIQTRYRGFRARAAFDRMLAELEADLRAAAV